MCKSRLHSLQRIDRGLMAGVEMQHPLVCQRGLVRTARFTQQLAEAYLPKGRKRVHA